MAVKRLQAGLLLASVALLSACGGSGGSSTSTAPVSPSTPATELTLVGDSSAVVNQAVGIVAHLPAGTYRQFQWQQTAGPQVALLADKTPGVGFDVSQAGSYAFTFTATKTDGSTLSKSFNLSVTDSTAPQAQARLDRAVSEGAEFSIRLNATGVNSISNWQFRQTGGPTAKIDTSSSAPLAFITAPMVDSSDVMTFEGTLTTDAGTLTDTFYVAVLDRPNVTSPYFCNGTGQSCATSKPLTLVHPYKASSPYASILSSCVYSNQLTDSNLCTINTLPPIGRNNSNPTVADIMNRVVVSHDWMGQRFEEFLTNLDGHDDFKHMLRATTAIVISSDVRPSFYWQLTGAIYLDGDSLWLTPNERDVINEQPDYRSSFGSTLQFIMPWRYVQNDNYAFRNIDPSLRQTRPFSELEADLGSLLYHELTHANDFMSQAKLQAGIDGNDIFYNQAVKAPIISDQLHSGYPLSSQQMHDLSQVSFQGATATATQEGYTPDDVAGFFFADNANDYYNYSTIREDLAMLFEETMMKLRYGIDRDVAVTNKPDNPTSGNDYIVSRGQRNRVGEVAIRPRAEFDVQAILPEAASAATSMLNTLTPTELCAGDGWTDNLTPACGPNPSQRMGSLVLSQGLLPQWQPRTRLAPAVKPQR
ncbi:hypothetical protein [Gallaecimonas sp. GXIMD1310]|uniref:hypothetical protein n=1 Tax=Gallaecimonas sp. GXIMD1310 TaxID=3131926 RepID=UPI00324F0352